MLKNKLLDLIYPFKYTYARCIYIYYNDVSLREYIGNTRHETVLQYLNDNVRNNYLFLDHHWWDGVSTTIFIGFKYEEDLLLFKLRFGEIW